LFIESQGGASSEPGYMAKKLNGHFSFFFMARSGGQRGKVLSRGRHERGLHTCSSLAMADSASTQPNTALYINNLNDKVNKNEIRSQLYALFTTYGKLIDVVATKTPKMRGQAFLVFTDLPSATAALRACDGMIFYNKPMVRPYRSCPIFCFSCYVLLVAYFICKN
jgi:RNA recognition motif-containing protein